MNLEFEEFESNKHQARVDRETQLARKNSQEWFRKMISDTSLSPMWFRDILDSFAKGGYELGDDDHSSKFGTAIMQAYCAGVQNGFDRGEANATTFLANWFLRRLERYETPEQIAALRSQFQTIVKQSDDTFGQD